MKKTYICTVDNANKFWSYETKSDNTVYIEWGRLGGNPQSQTKSFSSQSRMGRFIEKKVSEKIGKGYEEKTSQEVKKEQKVASVLGFQHKIQKIRWVRKQGSNQLVELGKYSPSHHILVEVMNSWTKVSEFFLLGRADSYSIGSITIDGSVIHYDLLSSSNGSRTAAIREYLKDLASAVRTSVKKFAALGRRVLDIGGDDEGEDEDDLVNEEVVEDLCRDVNTSSASDDVVVRFAALGNRVLDL